MTKANGRNEIPNSDLKKKKKKKKKSTEFPISSTINC